jgi:hypothetical protein
MVNLWVKKYYLERSTIDMLERMFKTESQNVSLKEEYNFMNVKYDYKSDLSTLK